MRLVLLLLWIFIFAGCTQQRMALRFADTAASWKADDYFDLTSTQKDEVKKQLKIFLKKAYEDNDREIPKTFDQIDQILSKADERNKLDCTAIDRLKAQTGDIFEHLAQIGAEQIQTLTSTLSEKQIQYFNQQVAEKIKEDEEKYKSNTDYEERRQKSALENARVFLGSLSKEQEKAIEAHVKANPYPFSVRLKDRKLNFERLKTASVNPAAFQKFVLDYVKNWRTYQSAEHLKQLDQIRANNERFYQNLVCEASLKQIQHLRKKLSEGKKDFEEFFL